MAFYDRILHNNIIDDIAQKINRSFIEYDARYIFGKMKYKKILDFFNKIYDLNLNFTDVNNSEKESIMLQNYSKIIDKFYYINYIKNIDEFISKYYIRKLRFPELFDLIKIISLNENSCIAQIYLTNRNSKKIVLENEIPVSLNKLITIEFKDLFEFELQPLTLNEMPNFKFNYNNFYANKILSLTFDSFLLILFELKPLSTGINKAFLANSKIDGVIPILFAIYVGKIPVNIEPGTVSL